MKADNRHVGISFCGGNLQMAEMEHGRKLQLLSLAQVRSSLDFGQAGITLTARHPQLGTLVKELGELLKRNKVKSRTISFALPSEPVFLNVVPLDPALKGKSLMEHLLWEWHQHDPATDVNDIIVDSLPVGKPAADARSAMLIAVRKGMIAFLQQAVQQLKLSLRIVDIDHFSIEHAVRANYPEIKGHVVLQVSVRYSGLNVSALHDGNMIDYRFLPLNSPDELVRVLSNHIKHRTQPEGLEAPQAIVLGGNDVSPEAAKRLRAETELQVIPVNPLRKIRIEGKIYGPFLKQSHRFAAAIGLALRPPA